MKYLLMVMVMGLITASVYAGMQDNWIMFVISLALSAVFGIVLIGAYAIEDINRNKRFGKDED